MTISGLSLSLGGLPVSSIGVPGVVPASTGYCTDVSTGYKYYYSASEDRWYLVYGGNLYPLEIPWAPSPSAKMNLVAGDTLKMSCSFKYIGPATTVDVYGAIGQNKFSGTFNEYWHDVDQWSIPANLTSAPVTRTAYVTVPVGSGRGGEDLAAYFKILNGITLIHGVNCTSYYYNVAHIIEPAGEITNLEITGFEKV